MPQSLQKYIPNILNDQLEKLELLKEIYLDWNLKINLISRQDIDNIIEKHFLHSLIISKYFDFINNTNIIDIGTGGGFPGIPLAIIFPNVKFYLLDSIKKKILVVEDICKKLNLNNVITICDRAENIKLKKMDFVLSRATAPLQNLLLWSANFLNNKTIIKNAGLICLKGGDLTNEIEEANIKPIIYPIYEKIKTDYYKEKYVLHISLNQII